MEDIHDLYEKIMQINFEGISCFHITQLLRGKLFYYVDNLLTYEYEIEDLATENFGKIIDFIFFYIKFCCNYLEKFKNLYPQVISLKNHKIMIFFFFSF